MVLVISFENRTQELYPLMSLVRCATALNLAVVASARESPEKEGDV